MLSKTQMPLLEIGHYEKQLLGRSVIYQLFMEEKNGVKTYGVRLSCDKEAESFRLNQDLFSCVSFLKKLVDGNVFPYSLCELVEDFLTE